MSSELRAYHRLLQLRAERARLEAKIQALRERIYRYPQGLLERSIFKFLSQEFKEATLVLCTKCFCVISKGTCPCGATQAWERGITGLGGEMVYTLVISGSGIKLDGSDYYGFKSDLQRLKALEEELQELERAGAQYSVPDRVRTLSGKTVQIDLVNQKVVKRDEQINIEEFEMAWDVLKALGFIIQPADYISAASELNLRGEISFEMISA